MPAETGGGQATIPLLPAAVLPVDDALPAAGVLAPVGEVERRAVRPPGEGEGGPGILVF